MAALNHAYAMASGTNSSSSTSYVNVSASANIDGSALIGDDEYAILFGGMVGGNSISNNGFEFKCVEDGVGDLSFSHARHESRRGGTTNGHAYSFLDKVTAASTPNDYDQQHKAPSGKSVNWDYAWSLAINLTELGSSNYKWDEDTTLLDALDNASWTDGASVTLGDGSSDWIVFYFAHVLVDSTSGGIKMQLDVGGTPMDYIGLEGEDTVEEYCIGAFAILEAPASSTDVTVQLQTDSATAGIMDVDCNRVFAMRLDAFENHYAERDTSDINVTAADTATIVGNVLHTVDTDATSDWQIMSYSLLDPGNSNKRSHAQVEDATLGLLEGNNTHHWVQNGHGDQNPIVIPHEETGVADTTSFDIDFVVEEESDVTPQPAWIDTHFAGWSWELSATVANGVVHGSMTMRGVDAADKSIASVAKASLGISANDVSRKEMGFIAKTRLAIRALSSDRKSVNAVAQGRFATRAAAAYSFAKSGAAVMRASLRGFLVFSTIKVVNAIVAGRIAIRGLQADSKTGGGTSVGRVSARGTSGASKTGSGTSTGRAALRGFLAGSALTISGVVKGLIALRGTGIGRKEFSSITKGSLALVGKSGTSGTKSGSALGRLIIRSTNDGRKTMGGIAYNRFALRAFLDFSVGAKGTISRVVPLDGLFDLRVSLAGRFSPDEAIAGTFDVRAALEGKYDTDEDLEGEFDTDRPVPGKGDPV